MEYPLLIDIIVLLASSVAVVLLFQMIRMPAILGFLVTGIIIGPYALGWVANTHEVEVLSEIGVILLLFVIGLELSLKQLSAMSKTVFIGGSLQVGLVVACTAGLLMLFGYEWNSALFIGFLLSLSSTAIVLRLLQKRNEINAPHGRISLGFLILQDIIVVPMMLLTPFLAGTKISIESGEILELLLKTILVVTITWVAARYLIPRLLHIVAKTNSKELFILTTITLCLGIAALTAEVGLSLALGAFLAGLIISESHYSHQATGIILPFRELFTSIFFISIGMLLDLSFFIAHIWGIMLIALLIFIFKGMIVSIAATILKYPIRTVILTGFALFQVGEFAFILSKVGIEYNLLSPELNQYFLSVSILTMALTPIVFIYADQWTKTLSKIPIKNRLKIMPDAKETEIASGDERFRDHLIIIGYGLNGKNVAKAARFANIPYIIIEVDANKVKRERAKGEDILFGDPVNEHVLSEVGITKAKVVVIAISDPQATKTIITNIRGHSQTVYVLARTRSVREIDDLIQLGADEVIPEEFETSIEIFSRVLHKYLVPLDELENLVNSIRADNYEMLRPQYKLKKGVSPVTVPHLNIDCIRILADSGKIVGKPLEKSQIRIKYGVNVLAITRGNETITQIQPDEKIMQNDLVYVSGLQKQISEFYKAVT